MHICMCGVVRMYWRELNFVAYHANFKDLALCMCISYSEELNLWDGSKVYETTKFIVLRNFQLCMH